jgi:hypothetical protein
LCVLCVVVVEVSATGWPLVHRSTTERGVWVWSWSLDNGPLGSVAPGGTKKRLHPLTSSLLYPKSSLASCQELVFMWWQNSELIKNLCLVFRVCAGMKQNSWLLYSNLLHLMSSGLRIITN